MEHPHPAPQPGLCSTLDSTVSKTSALPRERHEWPKTTQHPSGRSLNSGIRAHVLSQAEATHCVSPWTRDTEEGACVHACYTWGRGTTRKVLSSSV